MQGNTNNKILLEREQQIPKARFWGLLRQRRSRPQPKVEGSGERSGTLGIRIILDVAAQKGTVRKDP